MANWAVYIVYKTSHYNKIGTILDRYFVYNIRQFKNNSLLHSDNIDFGSDTKWNKSIQDIGVYNVFDHEQIPSTISYYAWAHNMDHIIHAR